MFLCRTNEKLSQIIIKYSFLSGALQYIIKALIGKHTVNVLAEKMFEAFALQSSSHYWNKIY